MWLCGCTTAVSFTGIIFYYYCRRTSFLVTLGVRFMFLGVKRDGIIGDMVI